MNAWSQLLFLRGHITNADLARSLAAAERRQAQPLDHAGAPGRPAASDASPTMRSVGAISPKPAPEQRPRWWSAAASRFEGEPANEGYRHGYGNRIANERALRPRWQRGPALAPCHEATLPCLSACG
jgi:hypothetical protein